MHTRDFCCCIKQQNLWPCVTSLEAANFGQFVVEGVVGPRLLNIKGQGEIKIYNILVVLGLSGERIRRFVGHNTAGQTGISLLSTYFKNLISIFPPEALFPLGFVEGNVC